MMRLCSPLVLLPLLGAVLSAQTISSPQKAKSKTPVAPATIPLHETSRTSLVSEIGGAFMSPSRCDADGNLYIRKYAADRSLLGPVVKIDGEGKRVALFDPAAFSQLALDRADAYSPAADGGMFQIAARGGAKPQLYVLHFSGDGSAASAIRLDQGFEVYSFVAFASDNFLVSGVQRETLSPTDRGHRITAIFSSDGRKLADLHFERETVNRKAGKSEVESVAPNLDVTDAEAGADGNVYALRRSSPALVHVISPAGEIVRTLKVSSPAPGAMPNAFHVSGNQLAISFLPGDTEAGGQALVVVDAQSGQTIRAFADPGTLGGAFACYSANDGVFTFLHLAEGNKIELVRAEAQ
jgi:hypothetical protein